MDGFTKREFTDHTLAEFLRNNGAIDNYEFVGNATHWREPNGTVLVVGIYTDHTYPVTYYVRNGK